MHNFLVEFSLLRVEPFLCFHHMIRATYTGSLVRPNTTEDAYQGRHKNQSGILCNHTYQQAKFFNWFAVAKVANCIWVCIKPLENSISGDPFW